MSIRIDGTNTTANPGITGGDADTGLQFGTDEISFVTGGTERVNVDNSKLHLSATGFPTIRVTDADNNTFFDVTNSDGDIILKGDEGNSFANSAIRFNIDGAEKARIQSGGGISFNGDTAAANALDDYEEGSFTPVLEQANSNPTSIVYNYQRGKYTKVGNVVAVWFDFYLTSFNAGNGRYRIGNLPFNSVSGQNHGGYGAPNFRASSAMQLDARLNSTSGYHANDYIELLHFSNSGAEVDTNISSGRITGMSFYYTT
jgi:hypothetical protein